MKALRYRFEWLLALGGEAIGRLLGRRVGQQLGRAMGIAWYHTRPRQRRVTMKNLAASFPELTHEQHEAIARGSFAHFGGLALDLLMVSHFDLQSAEDLVVVEGWEHLQQAHAKGLGVFVHSAHFGNWELVGLIQSQRGLPMDMVVRPLDNPHVEKRFTELRCRWGNRLIHKRQAVRGILRSLKEGRTIGMVIDQNYREANPFFVEFFGRPAATTPSLGKLAIRTGAPVVPVFCWPRDDGRYHIAYLPEVTVEPSGDPEKDAYEVTRRCTQLIEEQVRLRPELWSWMHQRWRTQPSETVRDGHKTEHKDRGLEHRRRAQG